MPACTRQRLSWFCYKLPLKQYSRPHPVSLPSCLVFPAIRTHYPTWDRRVNWGDYGTKADTDLLPSVSALLRYLLKSEVRMWTKDKASLCAPFLTPEPVRLLKWSEDTLYPERRIRKEARVTPTVSDWKAMQWEDHMFLPNTRGVVRHKTLLGHRPLIHIPFFISSLLRTMHYSAIETPLA